MLEAKDVDPELRGRVGVEDPVGRVCVVVISDPRVVSPDDEVRAAVVAPHDRVEDGFLRPRVTHPGRVRRQQDAVRRVVPVEQLLVAAHAHRSRDVVAFGLTDQRVQKQSVDDLESDLLQILMRAVHGVARLEPDHGLPAALTFDRPDLGGGEVELRKAGAGSSERHHLAAEGPAAGVVQCADSGVRIVLGRVNGNRLPSVIGRIRVGDVEDADRSIIDEETHAAGGGHCVGPQNDRNREGLSVGEPPGFEHRQIVVAAHERIHRRKGTGGEHEEVGKLTLPDLQPWQAARFGTKRVQLVPRWQSFSDLARQVAKPLQLVHDLRHRLLECLDRCIAHDLGVKRLFVRVADAGEVGDLTSDGLAIKPLDVALDQRVERTAHEHLDEVRRLAADLVANIAVRRDGGGDRYAAAPRDHTRDVADAPDVGVAVFLGEAESF